jgi:hypothetical protein
MAKHPIAIQVGRALRARTQAAGMSQDQFADHIDMHRAYYAAIERGEKKVTLKNAQAGRGWIPGVDIGDIARYR